MHSSNLRTRGFTLIELLVVIAIIGILAGIVLASLGSARDKGSDSKIKSQLSNIRGAAEIYYANNGHYGPIGATSANCATGGMAGDTGFLKLMQATNYPGNVGPTCNTDATAGASAKSWAAYRSLASDATKYWCVDSAGKSLQENTSPVGTPTACW